MHDMWQEKIAFYVAGTLPPDDARALEHHLSQCAHCRQAVAEWQAIASAVRTEAGQWSRRLPPLSVEVRAEVSQPRRPQPQLMPQPLPAGPPARVNRRGLAPLTALAAALMVVLFATLLTFLASRNNEPDVTEVAMLSIITMTREGREPATTGTPNSAATPYDDLGILMPTDAQGAAPGRTPVPSLSTPVTDPQTGNLMPFATSNPSTVVFADVCNVSAVGGSTVTLYQHADQNSAIVGSIGPGQTYVTYTRSADGWYQIIEIGPGILGWAPGSLLTLTGNCMNVMLPTPTMPANLCEGILISQQAELRGGPGGSFDPVGTAQLGNRLTILAQSDNGWYRGELAVGPAIFIGWLPGTSLTLTGDCGSLTTVPAAGYDPQNPETPIPSVTLAPSAERGAITRFTSSEETVAPGGSVTVQWTTSNASGVWLEYFGVNIQTGESSAAPIEALPNANSSGTWTVTIPAGFAYDGARFVIIVDNYDNGLGIPRAELVVRVQK